ncbi:MAG: signal peptidase I [Anaerotignum sp.]|nr:signal peptidase I [Anaerotignum sp.]MBQ3615889.1 signal peptidase I [Anaerotignum sp.]MBQ7084242.1 signal peptidase I [Anaerotignum sp.]MBR2062384.1 signal peptidase I [Anaerotignum sp.]MBR4113974.1 signal peptidase I [Anaerotignum sp.]
MEKEELEMIEETVETEEESGRKKKEKRSMPFVLQLVLLVVMVVILRNVMGTVLVKGSSMEPNFNHGDLVFINKLSTSIGSPDYGDVVICKLDEGSGYENIIKRVIGLPGDEIDIVENDDDEDVYDLYVNGEYIEEDFLGEPMMTDGNIEYPFEVPENSYFVMGDNRNESLDSRRESVGAIHKDDLMGKVVLRLYPFSEFGLID